MNHSRAISPRPGWGRLRAFCLFVLLGLVLATGQAQVTSLKIRDAAVDEFRQALLLERSDKPDRLYKRGELFAKRISAEAIAKAVAFRRKNLTEKASKLRRPNQLAVALLLPEWPLEAGAALPDTYAEKAAEVEKEVRRDLIKRLVSSIRRAFDSDTPARQVATATLLGEMVGALAGDLGEQERERQRELAASRRAGTDTRVKQKDKGRDLLYQTLLGLVDDLAKLADSSRPVVRTATARALGQFSARPKTAATTLRKLLAPNRSNPASTRRAAAQALITMIQAVSGTEPERSSEPGVSIRETKRTRVLFSDKEQVSVITAVVPVAAQGIDDSDATVRRTCTATLNESASALHQVLRGLVSLFGRPGAAAYTAEYSFPPPDRPWSKDEREAVREGRQFILETEQDLLKPALLAFTRATSRGDVSVKQALSRGAFDRDTEVRLNVRRTLDQLALVRNSMRDLRNAVPKESKAPDVLPKPKEKPRDKDKGKKKKDPRRDVRARPRKAPVLFTASLLLTSGEIETLPQPEEHLPVPMPFPAPVLRQDSEDKKTEDDSKDDDDKKKAEDEKKRDEERKKEDEDKDAPKVKDRKADPEVDQALDDLDDLLKDNNRELVQQRCGDRDPRVRRATFLAIEGLGAEAIPLLEQIYKATKDPDLFVRWTAARTLGKLGQPTSKLSGEQMRQALGLLGCLLDDEDLDVRIAAAKAIEAFGPDGAAAVQALAAHVNQIDAEYRIAVIRALAAIGPPGANSALPAIARELREEDPRLRAEAAQAMGRFGSAARKYIPDLTRLNSDPDSDVRRAASAALLNILED